MVFWIFVFHADVCVGVEKMPLPRPCVFVVVPHDCADASVVDIVGTVDCHALCVE